MGSEVPCCATQSEMRIAPGTAWSNTWPVDSITQRFMSRAWLSQAIAPPVCWPKRVSARPEPGNRTAHGRWIDAGFPQQHPAAKQPSRPKACPRATVGTMMSASRRKGIFVARQNNQTASAAPIDAPVEDEPATERAEHLPEAAAPQRIQELLRGHDDEENLRAANPTEDHPDRKVHGVVAALILSPLPLPLGEPRRHHDRGREARPSASGRRCAAGIPRPCSRGRPWAAARSAGRGRSAP